MIYAYLVSSILSLLLLIGYFAIVKNKNRWIFLLFISVFIVNFGYFLISVSSTVNFAIFANKIAYFGSIFLPISMIMIITKLCNFKYKIILPIILLSIASIIFLIICTTGYLPWYYKSVDIKVVNGGTILVKEYGPLHIVYLFYLIFSFLSMIFSISLSLILKKVSEFKHAIILCIVVFGNILVWFIEQKLVVNFEFLSISYLFSEVIILGLYWMIEDYSEKVKQVTTIIYETKDDKINEFIKDISNKYDLSSREIEILTRILQNMKRKDIALDLNLSENTIKTYVRNLYNKLNVSSRDELFNLLK